MALMAIGYRELSMSAASIGPVKAMTLSLDIAEAEQRGRRDAGQRARGRILAAHARALGGTSRECASSDASISTRPAASRFSSSTHGRQRQSRSHPAPSPRKSPLASPRARRRQYSALSRELNELEPVVAAIQAFQPRRRSAPILPRCLREPDLDPDMRAMAER